MCDRKEAMRQIAKEYEWKANNAMCNAKNCIAEGCTQDAANWLIKVKEYDKLTVIYRRLSV